MRSVLVATLFVSLLLVGCGGSDQGVCLDNDGDGVTDCAGDCDDNAPLNFPGGNEICGDLADNDCDMMDDEGCGGIGTFVSGTIGLPTNPGTQAQPVDTIARGMANAMTIGGAQSVIVAQGHYPEKIQLVEGIDLMGGYQCDTTSSWIFSG